MTTAYTWADGTIGFTEFDAPEGTYWIARGHRWVVMQILENTAQRHGATLCVPHADIFAFGDAFSAYVGRLAMRSDVAALGVQINYRLAAAEGLTRAERRHAV